MASFKRIVLGTLARRLSRLSKLIAKAARTAAAVPDIPAIGHTHVGPAPRMPVLRVWVWGCDAVGVAQDVGKRVHHGRAVNVDQRPREVRAGAYFHHGYKPESEEAVVIEVVGIPDVQMAGMNVLLLV